MAVRVKTSTKDKALSNLAKYAALIDAMTDEEGARQIGATELFRFNAIDRSIEKAWKDCGQREGWSDPVRPPQKGMKRGS